MFLDFPFSVLYNDYEVEWAIPFRILSYRGERRLSIRKNGENQPNMHNRQTNFDDFDRYEACYDL